MIKSLKFKAKSLTESPNSNEKNLNSNANISKDYPKHVTPTILIPTTTKNTGKAFFLTSSVTLDFKMLDST